MKFVNEFALKPGTQQIYKRRHDDIWPEMVDMMLRAGLENYSIWNTGTRLIEYYECADPDASTKVIHASPIKAKWDEFMKDILVFNTQGAMTPLTCMYDAHSTESTHVNATESTHVTRNINATKGDA
ncbi:MAG: L-rhamnose mutarotase [Clostridia bacterium]